MNNDNLLNNKITEKLVDHLMITDYSQFTPSVIAKAKQCFLDWLGSAFAGSKEIPTQILVELIDEEGGVEESTVINHHQKNSCLNAALVNAAMSHVLELDDVHRAASYHPAAVVIPAALAVAEKEKIDGKTFLTAIILGYEASIRIGEAVGLSHYKLWHTTATCGNFGSCVAAGKILHLQKDEMINAMGNAGTQAAGLWEFLIDGAMSKQLHPAKAAQNGLLAALLAKKGFTGAKRILEGEKGFCKATSINCDFAKITEGLDEECKMIGVSFKPYASCRHTHSAIDAVKKLMTKYNLDYHNIAKVTLETYAFALDIAGGTKSFTPQTPYQAKFSIPYCIALMLRYGKVGLDEFSKENLKDTEIQALMKNVQLKLNETLDTQYPQKWTCIMQVTTKDGKKYKNKVEFPKGDPENPLSQEELEDKFKELIKKILPSSKVTDLISKVNNLEHLQDMSMFFK